MPQIFTAAADTWLRAIVLTMAIVVIGVFGGGMLATGLLSPDYLTKVGLPVSQPVPFSHKHHVGDLALDCRYCHTGVETGADAGLPPTSTCMTCHSQIWTGAAALAPVRASLASGRPMAWNRVAQVPDYVYFNHAIHIDRGVPCVQCHGRVDQMPLTWRAKPFEMRFCLDCHRDPAPNLRPRAQVTRMDWRGWEAVPQHRGFGAGIVKALRIDPGKLANCGVCHR